MTFRNNIEWLAGNYNEARMGSSIFSYLMGFENHEYFFTAFKKKNGVTPADYRHLTQGNALIQE